MRSDDSSEPPQDATIIGSELDRYLRTELDDIPAASGEEDLCRPEAHAVSRTVPEPASSDQDRASPAVTRNPALAVKAFAFSGASMFLTDRRHSLVLMCNAAFLAMTGNRYEETAGIAPDLLAGSRSEESLRKMRLALARAESWDGEAWIRRRDGSEFLPGSPCAPSATGRFIPIAEETGLIRQVGEWVIRAVGMEMQAWRAAGLPPFRMALNLSALQIARPQHTEALSAAVVAAGMTDTDAEFEVEITESSLMTGEHTLAAATALKSLGLTLAIDDFGTGYSSMLALRQLPLDRIKIDRSFIKRLPADANDAAMTAAVIAMGKALGLRILAEGVETAEQLAFLRAHGCDEAQGFLFSHPLPIEAFRALLATGTVNVLPPERRTG